MFKRKKWLFVSLGVIVLLVIAGLIVVNKSSSREGVLEKISGAIDSNDIELLISVMPDEIKTYPMRFGTIFLENSYRQQGIDDATIG